MSKVVAMLVFLASLDAAAQEIFLPTAPIAPTEMSECTALSQAYLRIIQDVTNQHEACLANHKATENNKGTCAKASCQRLHDLAFNTLGKRQTDALDRCRAQVSDYKKREEAWKKQQEEERQRQLAYQRQMERQAEKYTNGQLDRIDKTGDSTRDTLKRQSDAVTSGINANIASLQQQRDYYAGLQDQRKKDSDSAYDRMRGYLDASSKAKDEHAEFSSGDRSSLQRLGDDLARRADDARRAAADWIGIPSTPTPEMSVLADVLRAPARKFSDYGMERGQEWIADKTGTRDLYEAGKEFKSSIWEPAMRINDAIESAKDWSSFISRNLAGQTTPEENLDHSIALIKGVDKGADFFFPVTPARALGRSMVAVAGDLTLAVQRPALRDLETAMTEFSVQVGSSGSTYSNNWNWHQTSYSTLRATYVPLTAYDRRRYGLATDDDKEPDQVTSGYEEFYATFKH